MHIGRGDFRIGRLSRWLAAAIAVTGLSASAHGTAAGGEAWRCSAGNGMFRNHHLPVAAEMRRIVGSMTFHKADFGRWMPTAKLGFSDSRSPDADCRCTGIKTKVFASEPDMIGVYLLADGEEIPLGRVPYEKPVTFDIAVGADNVATLKVGTGRQAAVVERARYDRISVSCSSADVSYAFTATR